MNMQRYLSVAQDDAIFRHVKDPERKKLNRDGNVSDVPSETMAPTPYIQFGATNSSVTKTNKDIVQSKETISAPVYAWALIGCFGFLVVSIMSYKLTQRRLKITRTKNESIDNRSPVDPSFNIVGN